MNKFKRTVILLLTVCLSLSVAVQFTYASLRDELPEDAVVIGFIDSGLAPYNMDYYHVLEGKNYVFEDYDTLDRIGHGTKTAGMVLGSTDGAVVGTFPDAYVVPLVVVDQYPSGVTQYADLDALIQAIYDAVDVYDCDIINMSLSVGVTSEKLEEAVNYACDKGVIIVCAAGNTANTIFYTYPAHYDSVIAIGAADGNSVASFSSTLDADFFYQGKNVSVISDVSGKPASTDSGSSFACASVSGIIGSWLSRDRELTLKDIRAILSENCMEGGENILSISSETELFHCTEEPEDIIGHWSESFVQFALENSLVEAFFDGSFRPNTNVTRAVAVYALYKMSGEEKPGDGQSFPDVEEGSKYADAIAWAARAGIVSGYPDGSFKPENQITREQLCTIFCKYAAYKGIALKKTAEAMDFVDKNNISAYAADYVNSCQQAGLVSGKPDGTFDPKGNATRGQFCAILKNLSEQIYKQAE